MQAGVPGVVLGLLTNRYLADQLEQTDFIKKESVVQRKNSILMLDSIVNELSEYILDSEIITIENLGWSSEAVRSAYNSIVRRLIQGTLYQFQVPKIYARKILGFGFVEKEVPPNFPKNAQVEFCSSKSPNKLFQLARLIARLHYEKQRKISPTHIEEIIKTHFSSCLQILRLIWNSPDIDRYNGSNVGSPYLLVRRAGQYETQPVPMEVGRLFKFSPIAKFCIGWEENGFRQDCLSLKQSNNPWGALLVNSIYERCFPCSEKCRYLRCTYQRPACDGLKVVCGNYSFAGGFCLGRHALYITKFDKTLKVGTAYSTNVIGRLLQQGAGGALVLWPVMGVKMASDMELALTRLLKNDYIPLHQDDVTKVVFAGPEAWYRLSAFINDWEDTFTELLEHVKDFIFSVPIPLKGQTVELQESIIHSKIIDLTPCYAKPNEIEALNFMKDKVGRKRIYQYDEIEGIITGYRGHFIFVTEKNIIDLRTLQGFVVEGDLSV